MIEEILGFYFTAKRFKGLGQTPVDGRVLDNNVKKIRNTIETLDDIGIITDNINKDEVLKRIAKDYNDGKNPIEVSYNRKELKCLSYNIGNNSDFGFVNYCLDLLKQSWSDSFLRGLLHSLLVHWTRFDDGVRQLVCKFFTEKILLSTSRYSAGLKPILKYLDSGGAYKLGNMIKYDKKDVHAVCQVFGLSTNRITYSYFSDAIVAYYETIEENQFQELKDVLKQHNNTRTSKVVVSKMILNYQNNTPYHQQLLEFAVNMIGDPTLPSKWAPFKNATREEERNLEKARRVLLRLFAERAIDTFFKYLCTDERRRKFWKRYSNKIKNFVVYGSYESKSYITPYINYNFLTSHYKEVASNSSTCGLVMYLGNYAIIEFSDTGALYAYWKDDKWYKQVFSETNRINKMDDLKLSFLPNLVSTDSDYWTYGSEGRLIHSGHWERRMGAWLERKIKKDDDLDL